MVLLTKQSPHSVLALGLMASHSPGGCASSLLLLFAVPSADQLLISSSFSLNKKYRTGLMRRTPQEGRG